MRLRRTKTVKGINLIWITFKAILLVINFPQRQLISINFLGGDRFCAMRSKMAISYFGNFNPRWPTFNMAYGVAVIIFFACLAMLYVCTKFGDSTRNFIFGEFLSRNVKKKLRWRYRATLLKFENWK